ncbi:MAG: carboxypeptidase regulatory-like domain-containing protein [bacterium]|nr:carboxypeptidase regulatory-like domain-containing protein [bacterium]
MAAKTVQQVLEEKKADDSDENEEQPSQYPGSDEYNVVDARKGRGSISGTIVGPEGGRLPGVMATLSSSDGYTRLSAVTSEHGNIRFKGLPAGKYDIRFKLEGFNTRQLRNISLTVAAQLRLRNIMLDTATIREEVTVSGTDVVDSVHSSDAGPNISIKPWDPHTPYMKEIKEAG